MDFHKVDAPRKKSSSVADQILDAVRRGTYREGSRLPPERELARLMGVSRNSVREAISALQIAGFVTTKVGDGTYVARVAAPQLVQGLSWLSDEGVDLLGIWQARYEIEQILLQEALEKATRTDIEGLRAVLSDMEAALAEGSSPKFSVNDIAFHLHIAGLSDNFPLVRAEHQLLSVARQFYRILDYSESPRSLEHLEISFSTHRDIVDAIENRDGVSAARATRAHFRELNDYLVTALESSGKLHTTRFVLNHRESIAEG
jgi:GntR family transcriptional repressor for pyruvate dehydrogenase complex